MIGQASTRYEHPDIQRFIEKKQTTSGDAQKRPSAVFSQKKVLDQTINQKDSAQIETKIKPQQLSPSYKNFKEKFSPKQRKNFYCLITFISSFLSFFLFYINVFPDFFLFLSFGLFILGLFGLFALFARSKKVLLPPPPVYQQNQNQMIRNEQIRTRPHELFLKQTKQTAAHDTLSTISAINSYHQYNKADRASATFAEYESTSTDDASIEQLASASLKKLQLSSSQFSKYTLNMKSFIQKRLLKKLVPEIHKKDARIQEMITIPNYEHQKKYVIQRIRVLANSEYLAGQYGDKGVAWDGKEWTTELPSDNQIVLHVLSVWISVQMDTMRDKVHFRNHFTERYMYIGSNPYKDEESPYPVMLCSENWSNFYVFAKFNSDSQEKFYAPIGRDSLYSALTIFFYIIKEKRKFILEGCNLVDSPFYMDKVFSNERIV